MIRHFVMLKFRGDVTPQTKAALYAEIEALKTHVPGIVGFHGGPNVSVETDLIRGNHDAFFVDFADAAARNAYLIHPEHTKAGGHIVGYLEGGIEGVTVIDMEI
jgi:hypothetical protein